MIYFSRKAFHGDPGGLVIEGESRTRLECSYGVVKLWEMDPAAALGMKTPGLWAFAPFMGGNREELAVKSAEKIRAASDSLIGPAQKGELLFLMAALLAGVVEDTKMSPQLLKKLTRDPENPLVRFLLKEGRKEGKVEGKAEGAVEQARRAVLHALDCRFGKPSPALVRRIEKISSRSKLDSLHRKAIPGSRIQDFLRCLE